MGLVIGLFSSQYKLHILLLRGAILGALVSLAFNSATGFSDIIGFLASVLYGVIIEFVLFKVVKHKYGIRYSIYAE